MTRSRSTCSAILTSWALGAAAHAQQPLRPPVAPTQNQITAEKAVLGKMLFWEEQLSSDNRMACGTCHLPEAGGTDVRRGQNPGRDGVFNTVDDVIGSPGVRRADANNDYIGDARFGFDRQVTPRKANAAINAAYFDELFWDGRATSLFSDPLTGQTLIPAGGALESQAVEPILDSTEMAHDGRTWADVTTKLASLKPMALATNLPADVSAALAASPTYPALFQAAFGDPAITPARIGYALATYERTLVPDQTPYDDFLRGNTSALTAQQQQGRQLFLSTQTSCSTCHRGNLLSDRTFRFTGVRPPPEDEGRFLVTGNPQDRGRFKVPALRNVSLHQTFMHSGQFTSLAQVVDFYNQPPPPLPGRDPLIRPLGLSPGQRAALVSFLEALTDPRVATRSGPFSRPTLHSERLAIGANQFGAATSGSAGSPQMISEGAAAVGLPDFRAGMSGGQAGAGALFGLSLLRSAPGTQISGVPVHIDPITMLLTPVTLNGMGAGTYGIAIPGNPALLGLQAHGQWFVPDPAQFYLASQAATWILF